MPFCNHTLAQTSNLLWLPKRVSFAKRDEEEEKEHVFLYPIPYLFCLIKVTLRPHTLKRVYRWGGSVLPQFFFLCPQQEVSHFVENEEREQNALKSRKSRSTQPAL